MYLGSKRMKKEETKKCLEMCLLAKHIFYSVAYNRIVYKVILQSCEFCKLLQLCENKV